jgi:hypothetical protein
VIFEDMKINKDPQTEDYAIFVAQNDFGQRAILSITDCLSIDLFDSKGKLLKTMENVLNTSSIRNSNVAQSSDNYIFCAVLNKNTASIFGHYFTQGDNDKEILFVVDKDFNYLKHLIIDDYGTE